MTDLQPCPFCGAQRASVLMYNRPSVFCGSCNANGPGAQRLKAWGSDNREEATKEAKTLWNKRAGGWQPIETIPLDGTPVLIWAAPMWKPDIAWENEKGGMTMRTYTHWMPLPEPPVQPEARTAAAEERCSAPAVGVLTAPEYKDSGKG